MQAEQFKKVRRTRKKLFRETTILPDWLSLVLILVFPFVFCVTSSKIDFLSLKLYTDKMSNLDYLISKASSSSSIYYS